MTPQSVSKWLSKAERAFDQLKIAARRYLQTQDEEHERLFSEAYAAARVALAPPEPEHEQDAPAKPREQAPADVAAAEADAKAKLDAHAAAHKERPVAQDGDGVPAQGTAQRQYEIAGDGEPR